MTAIINSLLAFIEGIGIIVSPCILPVLPIILAVGVTGGRKKPYGIMLGFIIAFCLFTLFARSLVLFTGVNLDIIRDISFVLLLLLAIIMMSSYLTNKFSQMTQKLSVLGESLSKKSNQTNGFWSGLLIGFPIGLIWTPCAGPIIAAVILQTIRAKTNFETILTLIMFSIGVAIPMLLIILFGKTILGRSSFLKRHAENIRKALGAIIFIMVLLNIQGANFLFFVNKNEEVKPISSSMLINGLMFPYQAPQIAGITGWINSSPLTLEQLKGKVVLVDFWTYSCINCVRTLPYLINWYNQYHSQGFTIIGVHSPEFAFEHNIDNVKIATTKYGIPYPIALDNNFTTWDNFQNRYWPAHYLIDRNGKVVYTHFGEGEYAVTENNIRILLGQKIVGNKAIQAETNSMTLLQAITPETYLGSSRSTNFANENGFIKKNVFQYPKVIKLNEWALQGHWQIDHQKIVTLSTDGKLKLHFQAKKVFLVLGSNDQKTKTAHLYLDGQPIGKLGGKDVINSKLTINSDALYELVNLPKNATGILEIQFDDPGTEAYAFTFG